jgi:hypothetical protein
MEHLDHLRAIAHRLAAPPRVDPRYPADSLLVFAEALDEAADALRSLGQVAVCYGVGPARQGQHAADDIAVALHARADLLRALAPIFPAPIAPARAAEATP